MSHTYPSLRRLFVSVLVLSVLFAVPTLSAADAWKSPAWTTLPARGWKEPSLTVAGLKGDRYCAVGYPKNALAPLHYVSDADYAPGLYRLRLTVRPSHVGGDATWVGGLELALEGGRALIDGELSIPAIQFGRVHEPDTKVVEILLTEKGPLRLTLTARMDGAVFEGYQLKSTAKSEPKMDASATLDMGGLEALDGLNLNLGVDRKTSFYYVVDSLEIAPLSTSLVVRGVSVDKVRYMPGDSLKASVTVEAMGPVAGGTLRAYLENDLQTRVQVAELPLPESERVGTRQTLPLELTLPTEELGYALVLRYESADGSQTSEAAEYFNIATNFYRVAIHGNFGHSAQASRMTTEAIAKSFRERRKMYWNCFEVFAWAEEDMVEMSPEGDYWFSGQTCYHINKQGMQRFIATAHENGVSAVTYGKFIMSGYLGWKTAYDYPMDHKEQYYFPIGMWEAVDSFGLDRFKNKQFNPPEQPKVGGMFMLGRPPFLPINPDSTPRMVRVAAEEVIRSAEMFGWDAVRWDGHPRGGGPVGGQNSDHYDPVKARKTQMLVRYFKDIIAAKIPNFQHGYNYYFVQDKPSSEWGVEEYELDELGRGGGLLMNESIRKQYGRSFEWLAQNIQVEGDLSREHDGFLLGISTDGAAERDRMVEALLYFAGGMRPYAGVGDVDYRLNRYATRYSRYTFDERLRRLAKPEGVLKPTAKTDLWWTPFVFETPHADGKTQLLVNLLNIDRKDKLNGKDALAPTMNWPASPGPVTFALNPPDGYTVTAAHLIDPWSLRVTPLAIDGGEVATPATNLWQVLILDLQVAPGTPTLYSSIGVPSTIDKTRDGQTLALTKPEPLSIEKDVVDVNRDMADYLSPDRPANWSDEEKNLDSLTMAERNAKLLEAPPLVPDQFIKTWWKGAGLPDDLKLKDAPPNFGDMTPTRNGRTDIFYARGAMDYRLRVYESFAGLPLWSAEERYFGGHLTRGRYSIWGNIAPYEMTDYDLLVYTDVPHVAVGVRQSYAMLDYVKAGGAAYFVGGYYAFGEGGYPLTVLDREVLPVRSVHQGGNRLYRDGLVIEPGPDFAALAELGAGGADFTAKPLTWCLNEEALRPGADVKVFLKAGNRPVLVGWQLGKGRVACLLATYRGKSEEGKTAFFDWEGWPAVQAAVMRWLTPDAAAIQPRPPLLDAATATDLREKLEANALADALTIGVADAGVDILAMDMGAGSGNDGGPEATAAASLDEGDLKVRTTLIRQLLKSDDAANSPALAGQLASIANLPLALRFQMLDAIRRHPPAALVTVAKAAGNSADNPVRGNGHMMLAIANDPTFPAAYNAEPPSLETSEVDRRRFLALALADYQREDLREQGVILVTEWTSEEQARFKDYTEGEGFTMKHPRIPLLDSERLYQRIAWLAYLSRFDAKTWAEPFAREWIKLTMYEVYADETVQAWWDTIMYGAKPGEKARVQLKANEAKEFKVYLSELRRRTQPLLVAAAKANPTGVAAGLSHAEFLQEGRQAAAILGDMPAATATTLLEGLVNAKSDELAGYARTRLALKPEVK